MSFEPGYPPVLVVDDESMNLYVLVTMLQEL